MDCIELRDFFKDTKFHVLVEPSLFTAFDKHWKPWDPAEDALRLAADIANDKDPAITYLLERGMLVDYKALGVPQFVMVRVVGKEDEIRRFVKSRQ